MCITRGGVEDTRLEAKAKDSLSEDRPSQGQGQKSSRPRPRTQAQMFSKKGLQKSFSGDLQFIGVPKIFDWERPKPQITFNDVIKNFQKKFVGQRHRRMEDLKSLPVGT